METKKGIVKSSETTDTGTFLKVTRPHPEYMIGNNKDNAGKCKSDHNKKWIADATAEKQPVESNRQKKNIPLNSTKRHE